jgi:hypothetical protein
MGISVVVPVGPNPVYKQYLNECLDSVHQQLSWLDQVVLVDDMAHLDWQKYLPNLLRGESHIIVKNKWLLGCAASWNIGVADAKNEWCILMGSDDKLLPGALDACREIINSPNCDPLGWYNFSCSDSEGNSFSWHNNATMVSKSLWRALGGFPLTSALGAPDALAISIMMIHMPEHLHKIQEGNPLYWVRVHECQNGRQFAGVFNQQVIDVRNIETARWTPPGWTNNV